MKTKQRHTVYLIAFLFSFAFSFNMQAQVNNWNPDLVKDSKEALAKMISDTPKLESFKSNAYGYAVFPKVTKAGIGIGGAAGKGVVYEAHQITGSSKLRPPTKRGNVASSKLNAPTRSPDAHDGKFLDLDPPSFDSFFDSCPLISPTIAPVNSSHSFS